MAIEKRTVVDQIEVTAQGFLQVRMCKQLVEDGHVRASEYHRTICEPGADVDAQLAAVNTHLAEMGCEPVTSAAWQRVRSVSAAVWTPAVLESWAAVKAAQEAERLARTQQAAES